MENCCILLAIYLNCTMMHVLTNFKFEKNFCASSWKLTKVRTASFHSSSKTVVHLLPKILGNIATLLLVSLNKQQI